VHEVCAVGHAGAVDGGGYVLWSFRRWGGEDEEFFEPFVAAGVFTVAAAVEEVEDAEGEKDSEDYPGEEAS
jgi:hypothetical protein